MSQAMNTAEISGNHRDVDMMHDAVRGDALSALWATSRNDAAKLGEAETDLADHIKQMNERMAANRSLATDPAMRTLLEQVAPALADYQKSAKAVFAAARGGCRRSSPSPASAPAAAASRRRPRATLPHTRDARSAARRSPTHRTRARRSRGGARGRTRRAGSTTTRIPPRARASRSSDRGASRARARGRAVRDGRRRRSPAAARRATAASDVEDRHTR